VFGEKEYGGYKPGPELYDNLNLKWFQTVGLLKPLMVRFKGNVRDAVDFAYPDGFAEDETKQAEIIDLPVRGNVPSAMGRIAENLWD
jgi:hypothetical protein